MIASLPDQGGREINRARPCIVAQSHATESIPLVTVVPVTSNEHQSPLVLEIGPGTAELEQRSYALIYQIRAIDRGRIHTGIGQLPDELLQEFRRKLRIHFDLW